MRSGITGIRKLRFKNLDDILTEARRIAAAPCYTQLGNWTAGQVFEHLAKSFHSSIDESQAVIPWRIRVVAKLLKPWSLRFGLPSGVSIRNVSEVAAKEFLPSQSIDLKDGLQLLLLAAARLKRARMSARHNLFGKMTHEQWIQLHCRHAELHFKFLRIEPESEQSFSTLG